MSPTRTQPTAGIRAAPAYLKAPERGKSVFVVSAMGTWGVFVTLHHHSRNQALNTRVLGDVLRQLESIQAGEEI